MTEQLDLDALEALAKAATPGPWTETDDEGAAYSRPPATGAFLVEYGADADQKMRDIRFIATADPSTVLALIAELRQERERADNWNEVDRLAQIRLIEERDEARAALSRAEETIDRINALLAPVLKRVDREQVGTHGPECHTRHLGCLALAIERALTEYGKQKGQADD